jgi:hypothetical protein
VQAVSGLDQIGQQQRVVIFCILPFLSYAVLVVIARIRISMAT